jgi:hypothetical protein
MMLAPTGEAMTAGRRVSSWGASTLRSSGGMTLPRSEPDPYACASEGATVGDGLTVGDRSARSRGGLRLVPASDRDASDALVGAEAGRAPERDRSSDATRVRRLRLAAPAQLELVSGREGPPPEVVWASLPERAREAVLVVLARLIGSGAIEEEAS